MRPSKIVQRDAMVCLCNRVFRKEIEAAMDRGACTLAQVFDATSAGCGPCGGTCQPLVVSIIRERLGVGAVTEGEL